MKRVIAGLCLLAALCFAGPAAVSAQTANVVLSGEKEVAISLEQPGFSVRFQADGNWMLLENGVVAEDPDLILLTGQTDFEEGVAVYDFLPRKTGKTEIFFVFVPRTGEQTPAIRRVSVSILADLTGLAVFSEKSSYQEGETASFYLTVGESAPLTGEIVWSLDGEEVGQGERLTLEGLQKGIRTLTAKVETVTGTAEASLPLRVTEIVLLPETVKAIVAPIGIVILVLVIILYFFRKIRKDPLETLDRKLQQCLKMLEDYANQACRQNAKKVQRDLRLLCAMVHECAQKAENCVAEDVYEAGTAADQIRQARRLLNAACKDKALSFEQHRKVSERARRLLNHSRELLSRLIQIRAEKRRKLKESNDRRAREEVSELKIRRKNRSPEKEPLAFLEEKDSEEEEDD